MSCAPQNATTPMSDAAMGSPFGKVIARLTRTGRAGGRLAPRIKEEWVLTLPPRWRGQADPMTGWWGRGDPLEAVTLRFPNRQAAENYARREGILLEVSEAPGTAAGTRKASAPEAGLMDPVLPWVWDGRAEMTDLDRDEPSPDQLDAELALLNPAGVFSAPMDVVGHPRLTRQEKLDILKQWEWDARLIEAAQAEGMPDKGEPSRLEEVLEARHALLKEGWRGEGARRPPNASRRAPPPAPWRAWSEPERRVRA